ncbi:hypothetical protein TNCV_3717801 [Trichonephila clavipes]|nr:hypothetical protein TNCV_3717801 [Trichonephila clavipes]
MVFMVQKNDKTVHSTPTVLLYGMETATHIGIREAEDWFRPIDLAKECDIYISSKNGSHKEIPITYGYTQDPLKINHKTLKQRLKRTIPNIMKEKIKIALYAVIHLIAQETPWQWKRRKKRNRFEQTSRTLQRKISMRSTKDQLVKKDVLMPVKQCVFPVEPSGCRRGAST